MSPEQALTAARNYISSGDKWRQGCRNDGDRMCALGAIEAVYTALGHSSYGEEESIFEELGVREPLLRAIREIEPDIDRIRDPYNDGPKVKPSPYREKTNFIVARFNNTKDHAAVVKMFDRAIQLAR